MRKSGFDREFGLVYTETSFFREQYILLCPFRLDNPVQASKERNK
jgi:hypothetical protein